MMSIPLADFLQRCLSETLSRPHRLIHSHPTMNCAPEMNKWSIITDESLIVMHTFSSQTPRQPQRRPSDEQIIDQRRNVADRNIITGWVSASGPVDIGFGQAVENAVA